MRERLWARVNARRKAAEGRDRQAWHAVAEARFLVGRVRHLKGEQQLRHATLREIS
jgi:hypothetical protein